MGKIFILGSSQQIIDFGHTYVNVPYLENDISMHNWIVQLFEKNDIEKIVIEISDFPELSLKLGYHIRLSIEKLSSKVLIPILFVNRISLNEVILNSRLSSQILGTKGVYFSDFNLEDNKLEIDEIKGINVSDYVTGFLNIINIQPDETIGRHSLANIWGAFAMDNAANTRVLDTDADFKKSLYFKKVVARNHLLHLSRSFESIDNHNLNHQTIRIEAQNKKILYIDDEANKGWESVLKKLFNTSRIDDIVVINEKVKDFDSLSSRSKAIIENEIFDLYLVDLRLNGLDEDENIKTEEFSGMKVLQKIKSINRGNQVIIFTASNKSWNQKSLIDYGADGYFVKESPEYNFSIELSKSKLIYFKDEVESCLKMFFLREVNSKLSIIVSGFQKIFYDKLHVLNEIDSYTNIFFDLINNTRNDFKYFNYAYLQLFLIIELFVSQEDIFLDGENAYVKVNDKEILVQQKSGAKVEQSISMIDGKYKIQKSIINLKSEKQKARRLDTNFKVSALLIFRYGNENSSVKKWTSIYTNRNVKTAHYNDDAGIKFSDILDLLNFIHYLIDASNIKLDNINKGLREKTIQESIEELKRSPFYKKH